MNPREMPATIHGRSIMVTGAQPGETDDAMNDET